MKNEVMHKMSFKSARSKVGVCANSSKDRRRPGHGQPTCFCVRSRVFEDPKDPIQEEGRRQGHSRISLTTVLQVSRKDLYISDLLSEPLGCWCGVGFDFLGCSGAAGGGRSEPPRCTGLVEWRSRGDSRKGPGVPPRWSGVGAQAAQEAQKHEAARPQDADPQKSSEEHFGGDPNHFRVVMPLSSSRGVGLRLGMGRSLVQQEWIGTAKVDEEKELPHFVSNVTR